MCLWWDRAIHKIFGVDAPEKELRERELGLRIGRSNPCGGVCAAASRSRVGIGREQVVQTLPCAKDGPERSKGSLE